MTATIPGAKGAHYVAYTWLLFLNDYIYGTRIHLDVVYFNTQYTVTIVIQSNLSITNPGYNELPDTTNIDLRMCTYLL